MPQARPKKPSHLVLGFLEGISSRVFSEFSQEITELVGQKQGVYALYKGNRLYYVGLATNLRARVKQHLRDKHKGKWNKFSMYLVRKSEHIKELESLILRIADPKGNTVRGGLPDADNLRPKIRAKMKAATSSRIDDLLGRRRKRAPRAKAQPPTEAAPGRPETDQKQKTALAGVAKRRFKVRGTNKGRTYEAWVETSGEITFEDSRFRTPSGAAKAALGRAQNGWYFWRYQDPDGNWVFVQNLRGS